jgi:hypothetical protein
MADHLILRGYKHIENRTSTDIEVLRPPGSLGHFNTPRWWNRSSSVVYVPAVKLSITGYADVTVVGNRTLHLRVGYDAASGVVFNFDKRMKGVERIKVEAPGGSADFDDYRVNGVGELVKSSVGAGFSAPTAAPANPPAQPAQPAAPANPPAAATQAPITVRQSALTPGTADEVVTITFDGGPSPGGQRVSWGIDNDGNGEDVQNGVTINAGMTATQVAAALVAAYSDPDITLTNVGPVCTLTPAAGDHFRSVTINIV